jgi:hypothetical protein
MQLTDGPLVEVALLLIGLTHISFDKTSFEWTLSEEISRLLDCQLSLELTVQEWRNNSSPHLCLSSNRKVREITMQEETQRIFASRK